VSSGIPCRLDAVGDPHLSHDRCKWNPANLHAYSCSCVLISFPVWIWAFLLLLATWGCRTGPLLSGTADDYISGFVRDGTELSGE
jgi:hypothetical protein